MSRQHIFEKNYPKSGRNLVTLPYPMTTDKQDVIDQPGIAQSGIHIVQNKIFFASDT